jgi:hypothetical protein
MSVPDLKGIADVVVRRAQDQGFVVPRQIRAELVQAGVSERHWKEVVALARPALSYRRGRYYYVTPAVARLRARSRHEQDQQRAISKALRQLIRRYKRVAIQTERREHGRTHFIQQIRVFTADKSELNFLSRDVSLTGLRMIGNRNLLGQKVRVMIPPMDSGSRKWCFLIHVLWTNRVADGIFESGGIFLEMVSGKV